MDQDQVYTGDEIEDRTLHMGIDVQPRAMKDTENRDYWEFELSNEEKDLHKTVFKSAGGQIDDYNAEPIVTYGHPPFDSTDPDDIIGIGPVYKEGSKLIGRFYPEQGGSNTKAAKVVSKLQQGMIRSASIVAYIERASRGAKDAGENPDLVYFRDWSLLMWGIVMKGSNPKAKLRTAQRVASLVADQEPVIVTDDIDTANTRQRQLAILTEISIVNSRANAREHGLHI